MAADCVYVAVCMWLCVCGCVYVAVCMWLCVAVCGHVWPCAAVCGCAWLCEAVCPLALALAKTDVWEGHAGQTQATSSRMQNP